MKVSALAQATGQPGQVLGSVEVGRTANPVKMERARAIARGEKVPEEQEEQLEKPIQNARSIKLRTQRSVYRDEPPPQEAAPNPESTAAESIEPAVIEETKPLSPQFAALAKEKRAAQVMKADAQKLMDEAKALQASTKDAIPLSKLKSDALSVLRENGILDANFYNALTDDIIGNTSGINPEIQALRDEIKALKGDVDKTFSSQEERAEESALTEMLYEAESLAKEGEDFEMVRERDAYDQVLRLIHSTYKKTGRVMDTRDAMSQIEDKLLKEAEKFASIKKVQSRMTPQPAQLQSQPRQMRTLTARDTASNVMSAKQRAIAAFNGTLRK